MKNLHPDSLAGPMPTVMAKTAGKFIEAMQTFFSFRCDRAWSMQLQIAQNAEGDQKGEKLRKSQLDTAIKRMQWLKHTHTYYWQAAKAAFVRIPHRGRMWGWCIKNYGKYMNEQLHHYGKVTGKQVPWQVTDPNWWDKWKKWMETSSAFTTLWFY